MAKIEISESWAGVADPLRALIAELDGDAHAGAATVPDPAAIAVAGRGEATRSVQRCEYGSSMRKQLSDSGPGGSTRGVS